MAESRIAIVGTGSGAGYGTFSLQPIPGEEAPETVRFTTRGRFPSYGSGPYFCVTVGPEEITLNKNTISVGLQSSVKSSGGGMASEVSFGNKVAGCQCAKYIGAWRVTQGWIYEFLGWDSRPDGSLYALFRDTHTSSIPGWNYTKMPIVDPLSPSSWISAVYGLESQMSWTEGRSIRIKNPGGAIFPSSWCPVVGGWRTPSPHYKFNELDTFLWAADYGMLMNGSAAQWSSAYANALEETDLSDVNSFGNILEAAEGIVNCCKTLRNIFRGDWGKVVADMKSALDPRQLWLTYRYSYTTTKADIEAYKKMLQRLGDLASAGRYVHSTGMYSDGRGSYKVELIFETDQIIPKDTLEFLAAIGVEPTAENIWDLIPYSFMVDWFFHISDIMEWADSYGEMISFPIVACWFTYMSEYDTQHIFYRVSGRPVNIPPIYRAREASGKTINMRVADTLSIFGGKVI